MVVCALVFQPSGNWIEPVPSGKAYSCIGMRVAAVPAGALVPPLSLVHSEAGASARQQVTVMSAPCWPVTQYIRPLMGWPFSVAVKGAPPLRCSLASTNAPLATGLASNQRDRSRRVLPIAIGTDLACTLCATSFLPASVLAATL